MLEIRASDLRFHSEEIRSFFGGWSLLVTPVHFDCTAFVQDTSPTAPVFTALKNAAISTLLGSPLLGAFLLMEASGLGGAMLELVLVPGLLAAGVGSLVFIGLDAWTGLGTFSLAIPNLPHVGPPTGAEFLWALAIASA